MSAFVPPPPSSWEGPATTTPASGGFTPPPVSAWEGPAAPARGFMDEAGDYLKGAGEEAMETAKGIIPGINQAFYHPIDTISSIGKAQGHVFDKAADAFKKGDYGKGIRHSIEYAVPVLGPKLSELGDEAGSGQPGSLAKSLGRTTTLGLSMAAPEAAPLALKAAANTVKKIPAAVNTTAESLSGLNRMAPEQLVTKGLRGSVPQGRTNFYQNLSVSMPAVKAAESALGRPIASLDDMIGSAGKPGAIQVAKRANRAEFNRLLGPQQEMGTKIDLNPVADAIENSLSHKTRLENPGEAARIKAIADKYRNSFDVDTVDSLLRSTNAELNSYYGKNPAARRVAASANPDTAMLDAQGQALRDAFYNHLDAPQQGAAARQLQREYGSLSELQDAMEKRKNVALRQAPDSLSEQIAKWESLGDALRGGMNILRGNIVGGGADILTALGKAKMAKWIKEQQTTDSLIKRAFANHNTPRTPVEFPLAFPPEFQPAFQPAGLLEPGATRMPGVPDPSGPIPMQLQPEWSQPPHRGLLPPARGNAPGSLGPSGEPIITPAPEGSHPVSGPMAPQYPVGSGNNRLLGHPQSIPGNPGPFGMSMGDDLTPVTHPETGKVEYVPRWVLQGGKELGGAKVSEGTVVRSKSNPAVRMVLKGGEWIPLK